MTATDARPVDVFRGTRLTVAAVPIRLRRDPWAQKARSLDSDLPVRIRPRRSAPVVQGSEIVRGYAAPREGTRRSPDSVESPDILLPRL